MEFSGVHTPIVTPFDADGGIDYGVLEQLIGFQIDNGVVGILPGGSTGEFYALTPDERHALNRFVMECTGDRAFLMAGTNATTTADVIAYSRDAQDMGYSAVMLAPPYYSLPEQDDLLRHFLSVLDAIDIPLVLYNFPGRAGVEIGYDVLDGLADHPQVAAIKESSGDITRLHSILERYQGRIQLICGADDQAYEYFAWGVKSWICGAANPAPAENVAVLNAAVSGDLAAAKAAMETLMPLVVSLEGGKYIQKAKYGMELAGVPCGPTRAPLLELSAAEKAEFKAIYESLKG
ncbi:MAG: dihydrodipicolinate synthase family protein [Rhodospirillales bacterium]|nr:dihydrodipicolinate synthase family protein [Rhodospirillales bacterium]